MNIDKNALFLYAVTDRGCLKGKDLEQAVEEAILGGITCVQLREKNLPENELISLGERLLKICRKYNVPFIINDDYKIALKIGADGVHVGIEDAPVAEIRKIAGDKFIIGATAKTVEQAKLAESSGADYLGVGAVFPSPTKTNAIRITPSQLTKICSAVKLPSVAIGGITADNVREIKGCGHCGVAVVSAVFGADDVTAAAQRLCRAVSETL